jgi:glycosyltransferase involved in cell wall biosynthesis
MKIHKRKTCLLTFNLEGGGAQRNTVNLLTSFIRKKIPTELIFVRPGNDYLIEFPKLFNSVSPYILVNRYGRIPFPLKPVYAGFALCKLFFRIIFRHIDVIIAMVEPSPYYLATAIARILGRKSVIVIHFQPSHMFDTYAPVAATFHKMLFRLSVYISDSIVCVSQGIAWEIEKLYPKAKSKIVVIYNGVDAEYIRKMSGESRRVKGISRSTVPALITVGHFTKRKNHKMLLRAFRVLQRKIPVATLTILGHDGPTKSEVTDHVRESSLNRVVDIPGFVENPYVLLSRASVYIHLSKYEGFGNAIVEAMVCGLPVIALDNPFGASEIVLGENTYPRNAVKKMTVGPYGILLSPESSEKEIADGIYRIIQDKRLYLKLSSASRKRARDFPVEMMCRGYTDLMNRLFL